MPVCVHPCVPCVSLNCLLAVFPQKFPSPNSHPRGNNLFRCDFEKMILFLEGSVSSYSFFVFHKKDSLSPNTFILLTAMLVSSIGPFLLPENQKPASLVCNSSLWQVVRMVTKRKILQLAPLCVVTLSVFLSLLCILQSFSWQGWDVPQSQVEADSPRTTQPMTVSLMKSDKPKPGLWIP